LGAPALRVGVLALQGAVEEHMAALTRVGAIATPVKTEQQLDAIDGLIIPGGESTTVIRLLDRFEMKEPLIKRARAGLPLWGTCMGMILVAHDVVDIQQPTLDLLDVTVRRNAFGRQVASAEIPLVIPVLGDRPFPGIFIRAPWIERAGDKVEVLAERDGYGVLVRQGHLLGSSFHPELSGDDRLHEYFLKVIVSQ
jgi:5'-phosphate synthase pdxT subunit